MGVRTPQLRQYFNLILRYAHRRPGWVYSSLEELVQAEGLPFPSASLPEGIPRRKKGMCFMNSYHLTSTNPWRYVYVEGYAVSKLIPIPLLHAWCYDRVRGAVVDVTWADGVEYYGIPLRLGYVRRTIATKETYGVLDNMEMGYPLIRSGLPPRHKARGVPDPRRVRRTGKTS